MACGASGGADVRRQAFGADVEVAHMAGQGQRAGRGCIRTLARPARQTQGEQCHGNGAEQVADVGEARGLDACKHALWHEDSYIAFFVRPQRRPRLIPS